jgi:hypothetical protein
MRPRSPTGENDRHACNSVVSSALRELDVVEDAGYDDIGRT